MASAMKPKNAAETEMLGPKPILSTTGGKEAPMIAATRMEMTTARTLSSRRVAEAAGAAFGDGETCMEGVAMPGM